MAGADNILFNTRERVLSADLNDVEAIVTRNMAELLRFMFHDRAVAIATGGYPRSFERDVVLGGLVANPDGGAGVNVSAGAMLQFAAAVLPAPGALDSDYRIGINRSVVNVAAPNPGANTYYLLEAQMTEVVALNELRDIYTAPSGPFVPTAVDKRLERQIAFQFTAGTSSQAPDHTADWVPIAVIFRPGGGGAVAQADISDVRPLWMRRLGEAPRISEAPGGIVTSWTSNPTSVPGTYTSLVELDVEAYLNGEHLFARTALGVSVNVASAAYIEPGIADPFPSSNIYYLYLCAPRDDIVPTNQYADNIAHRGILVLSRVYPTSQHVNVANISLPAPWAGLTASAGRAVCIGAYLSNGTGFVPQSCDRSGHHIVTQDGMRALHTTLNVGTVFEDVALDTYLGGNEVVPRNIRALVADVGVSAVDATQGATLWEAVAVGGAVANQYAFAGLDRSVFNYKRIELPMSLTHSYRFRINAGTIGTANVDSDIAGWAY